MSKKTNFSGVGECNLCGADRFNKIVDKLRDGDEKHKIYRCLSCGHVQLLPRPSVDEDKKYYDKDSQEKAIRPKVILKEQRENFKYDILRRANFIAGRFSKNKKILDVGSGYGLFLEEMSSRGYKIKGIEISRERRKLARTITNAPILDVNFNETCGEIGQVDGITLFHVLEHVVDPVRFCRNIHKMLKKNGVFIVEVPNVDELMLQNCESYNEFYWIRAHLSYFNGKTLGWVLKEAGFKKNNIIYVQRYGIDNLSQWLKTGKPQIEKPVFEIDHSYKWLEDYYKEYLTKIGRTDTLFAIAQA